MSLSKNILEEEIKNNSEEFIEKLIKSKENLHNGETFKYENDLEDIRYPQYKTVITSTGIEEKDYFIYEEIIKINDKPTLLLKIHNDDKREILELIIFLEKDNNVVQQISRLSYDEFLQMVKNEEQWIKTEETNNVTLIKTPLLDFIENISIEPEKLPPTILEQENVEKKYKKYLWWIIKFIAFFGCIVFSTTLGLVPTAVILGIVAIKPIAIGVSIVLGFIAIPWNNIRNKIVDWVFKKKKTSYEEKIEKLENEKINQNQKYNKLKREMYLTLTPEAKQERILNGFQQILERNKNKDFENLWTELSEKFEENKKLLEKQNFAKTYEEKIKHWNENWNEKVEFTKSLNPEHTKEIKEIFKQSENSNTIMCDVFFYQPKEAWEKFKQEEILEDISKLQQEPTKNDKIQPDLRKKSPIKNMKI